MIKVIQNALTLIFGILLSTYSFGQQNLVPNPSFEDTVFCPDGFSQLHATSDWLNFGITPDYFNSCATNGLNVPNASSGFQYARSGNGMVGFFLRRKPNSPDGPNAREYIATLLNSNLVVGNKYYFTCYINFSNSPSTAVACNKFGMKLSTISFDSLQYQPLITNSAHVYSDSIISDSLNWYQIKGSVIADSIYQYLILGNFFEDSYTDTINYVQYPDYSYYYVDDICFSMDSLFCENWTSTQNYLKEELSLLYYPNPVIDKLFIECDTGIERLEIFDTSGRQIDLIELNFSKFYCIGDSAQTDPLIPQ